MNPSGAGATARWGLGNFVFKKWPSLMEYGPGENENMQHEDNSVTPIQLATLGIPITDDPRHLLWVAPEINVVKSDFCYHLP